MKLSLKLRKMGCIRLLTQLLVNNQEVLFFILLYIMLYRSWLLYIFVFRAQRNGSDTKTCNAFRSILWSGHEGFWDFRIHDQLGFCKFYIIDAILPNIAYCNIKYSGHCPYLVHCQNHLYIGCPSYIIYRIPLSMKYLSIFIVPVIFNV